MSLATVHSDQPNRRKKKKSARKKSRERKMGKKVGRKKKERSKRERTERKGQLEQKEGKKREREDRSCEVPANKGWTLLDQNQKITKFYFKKEMKIENLSNNFYVPKLPNTFVKGEMKTKSTPVWESNKRRTFPLKKSEKKNEHSLLCKKMQNKKKRRQIGRAHV